MHGHIRACALWSTLILEKRVNRASRMHFSHLLLLMGLMLWVFVIKIMVLQLSVVKFQGPQDSAGFEHIDCLNHCCLGK